MVLVVHVQRMNDSRLTQKLLNDAMDGTRVSEGLGGVTSVNNELSWRVWMG